MRDDRVDTTSRLTMVKRSESFFAALIALAGLAGAQPSPVGRWTFDNTSNLLAAAVGNPLALTGRHTAITGPSAGNGAVRLPPGSYYTMTHGIAANGGGTKVNQWTLVIDLRALHIGHYMTFFQTNPANNDDADCFINPAGQVGVTQTTYSSQTVTAGKWTRFAISVDNASLYRIFMDGVPVVQSSGQGVDGRYSLSPAFLIFADDNGEVDTMDIADISMYSRALTNAEIAALGGIIDSSLASIKDWPTFRHDIGRTATSLETVTLPLNLQWVYIARHAPSPAWPPPAKQDFWGGVPSIAASNAMDRAYQVVVGDDRVFFGSNTDGKVYSLDAANGRELWSFFTEGPVRFAPSVGDSLVYFGSDDGRAYCCNASSGRQVWRYCYDTAARRMAGNERLISSLPVRTDVLVRNGNCYFGTGLFPTPTPGMGAWRISVNALTGAPVNTQSASYAPEGYLIFNGTSILCPTSQLGNQAFMKSAAFMRKMSAPLTYNEYDGSVITVGSTTFRGDSVRVTGGTWSSPVNGRAYSLAFSNGRLFVSTSSGYIYCFASTAVTKPDTVRQPVVDYPYASIPLKQQYAAAAQRILSASGVTSGYCLVLNSEGGHLAYELAKASNLQIICIEPDSAKVAASRRQLDSGGVLNRVTVQRWVSGVLPYSNMFFNIVTYDGYGAGTAFSGSRSEAKRVLRPYGGMAFFGQNDTYRKGAIIGADEWTHNYNNPRNNPFSKDQFVTGTANMRLQWFGKPGPRERVDRHHRTPAPLWKDGVMFVPGENWLTAADAYNGAILWDKAVPNSSRMPGFRDAGQMAAAGDYLYIASGTQCLGLTPREGNTAVTLAVPDVGLGTTFQWGYIALVDTLAENLVLGSAEKNHVIRYASLAMDYQSYFDNRPWVVSSYLFALNRYSGIKKWHYIPGTGVIINSTVLYANNRVIFLESTNAATKTSDSCRFQLSTLLGNGATSLVGLNAQTGAEVFRRSVNLSSLQHCIYMMHVNDRALISGSYNQGNNAAYTVWSFSGTDGSGPQWTRSVTTTSGTNGDHGDQDGHPVVVGNLLYILSFHAGVCVNISTGQNVTWAFNRNGHGCSQVSATGSYLYYRGGNPQLCAIASNTVTPLTTVTRSGCWINMVPAGGMLNIPEYSSGCTCAYSLQTSLSFLSTAAMPVDSQVTMSGRRNGSAVMPAPRLFLSRSTHVLSVHVTNLLPAENVTIRIMNVAGRTLFAQSGISSKSTHTFTWNCRNLSMGLYLISVRTPAITVSQKLLIVRH